MSSFELTKSQEELLEKIRKLTDEIIDLEYAIEEGTASDDNLEGMIDEVRDMQYCLYEIGGWLPIGDIDYRNVIN